MNEQQLARVLTVQAIIATIFLGTLYILSSHWTTITTVVAAQFDTSVGSAQRDRDLHRDVFERNAWIDSGSNDEQKEWNMYDWFHQSSTAADNTYIRDIKLSPTPTPTAPSQSVPAEPIPVSAPTSTQTYLQSSNLANTADSSIRTTSSVDSQWLTIEDYSIAMKDLPAPPGPLTSLTASLSDLAAASFDPLPIALSDIRIDIDDKATTPLFRSRPSKNASDSASPAEDQMGDDLGSITRLPPNQQLIARLDSANGSQFFLYSSPHPVRFLQVSAESCQPIGAADVDLYVIALPTSLSSTLPSSITSSDSLALPPSTLRAVARGMGSSPSRLHEQAQWMSRGRAVDRIDVVVPLSSFLVVVRSRLPDSTALFTIGTSDTPTSPVDSLLSSPLKLIAAASNNVILSFTVNMTAACSQWQHSRTARPAYSSSVLPTALTLQLFGARKCDGVVMSSTCACTHAAHLIHEHRIDRSQCTGARPPLNPIRISVSNLSPSTLYEFSLVADPSVNRPSSSAEPSARPSSSAEPTARPYDPRLLCTVPALTAPVKELSPRGPSGPIRSTFTLFGTQRFSFSSPSSVPCSAQAPSLFTNLFQQLAALSPLASGSNREVGTDIDDSDTAPSDCLEGPRALECLSSALATVGPVVYRLSIDLEIREGDADLYVASNRLPLDLSDFEWNSAAPGNDSVVIEKVLTEDCVLSAMDPSAQAPPSSSSPLSAIFLAIHSRGDAPASCSLSVTERLILRNAPPSSSSAYPSTLDRSVLPNPLSTLHNVQFPSLPPCAPWSVGAPRTVPIDDTRPRAADPAHPLHPSSPSIAPNEDRASEWEAEFAKLVEMMEEDYTAAEEEQVLDADEGSATGTAKETSDKPSESKSITVWDVLWFILELLVNILA